MFAGTMDRCTISSPLQFQSFHDLTNDVWKHMFLPIMMHQIADALVVNRANLLHRFRRERGLIGGCDVLRNLRGTLRAGNRARDGGEHQNPAQSELRQCHSRRKKLSQLFHCFQRRVVIHAGKCFAAIECFAVAIERAMIVRRELALMRMFAYPWLEVAP